MTGELSPAEAKVLEIVNAASHGDASNYPEHGVLTGIGAVFIACRRVDEPDTAHILDQALELLAAEIEARVALRDSPLPDPPGPEDDRPPQ